MPPEVGSTGEDAMLDFEYTLAVCSFLFIFVLLVHGRQTSGAVAGVEYPN